VDEVLAMLPALQAPLFGPRRRAAQLRQLAGAVLEPGVVARVLAFHLVPLELRHSAASLAIESEGDTLNGPNMLGHSEAAVSNSIHAHKFEAPNNDVTHKMLEDRQRARQARANRRRVPQRGNGPENAEGQPSTVAVLQGQWMDSGRPLPNCCKLRPFRLHQYLDAALTRREHADQERPQQDSNLRHKV
jgi:hypothetical protein